MKNNSAGEHEIISSSSSLSDSEVEDREVVVTEKPPPTWGTARSSSIGGGRKRLLRKQLSMRETTREAKWEKRCWQILHRRKMMEGEGDEESSPISCGGGRLSARVRSLTDEDWDELMGSIELGFGFNEEDGGHHLRIGDGVGLHHQPGDSAAYSSLDAEQSVSGDIPRSLGRHDPLAAAASAANSLKFFFFRWPCRRTESHELDQGPSENPGSVSAFSDLECPKRDARREDFPDLLLPTT